MKRHLKYLSYVLRHKWFVFLAACKLGIPWLGIIHDLSKFRLSEWLPYARHFHNPDGSHKEVRGKTGYYKPTDTVLGNWQPPCYNSSKWLRRLLYGKDAPD